MSFQALNLLLLLLGFTLTTLTTPAPAVAEEKFQVRSSFKKSLINLNLKSNIFLTSSPFVVV